ncbi:unnamed protein product, partial [marine sediment metagenome]
EGHSDEADAIATSVFVSSKEKEHKQASAYTGEDFQEEESLQGFVDRSISDLAERRQGLERWD